MKLTCTKDVKPGAPMRTFYLKWKQDSTAFPGSLRKKKLEERADCGCISFLLCNAISQKQCILRLKFQLKAYLSPKAKHKNILIFSAAEPAAGITDRLLLQTDLKTKNKSPTRDFVSYTKKIRHASSSTAHVWFTTIFLCFLQNWRKLFTTASLHPPFFLFNTYCQWVGASITHWSSQLQTELQTLNALDSLSYLFPLMKTLRHSPIVHDSRGLSHRFQFSSTAYYNCTVLHTGMCVYMCVIFIIVSFIIAVCFFFLETTCAKFYAS